MKKLQKGVSVLIAVLLISGSFIGCGTVSDGTDAVGTAVNTALASAEKITGQYKDEDLDSSWNAASATNITLNGTSATSDGGGVVVKGSTITIGEAGTYVVSGTLKDGQIVIAATKDDTIKLVLNGVNITCSTGAPIYASKSDKVIITLADNTENTVTDGGTQFTYADAAAEEPDAAVFSKNDLTINGSGTLTVNASFNNGIGTKDDLVIASGNIIVKAVNHGLRGRDSLTVVDGNFTISAGNDGIQSNNDEDTEKGWISLEGGSYNIIAAHDGIQAETVLSVLAGSYEITTGDGTSTITSTLNVTTTDTTTTEAISDSYKGLKANTDLAITGGKFIINSVDDAIHSNNNIAITNGEFAIESGDDGVHADADLAISGGTINVSKSYEGLEGATINISGGTIDIVSSDDGINAAGGSSDVVRKVASPTEENAATSEAIDRNDNGKFRKDSFSSSGNYYVNIAGGNVTVNAGGDGIDSNQDITISGGTIVVLINSTRDNEAMDYDGIYTVTGGTIIYGGTNAGAAPSSDDKHSYVYLSAQIKANSAVTVQQNSKTIVTFIPAIACATLIISSPDIVSGESYDIYQDGAVLSTATAGTGGASGPGFGGRGGGMSGGDRGTLPDGTERVRPEGAGGNMSKEKPAQ